MEDVPPEYGAVRAVFIPVERVGVQDKKRVFPQRIHFSVHEKVAAVGKDQHELDTLVVMQPVHAPLVVLLVLNAVITRFHDRNPLYNL